MSFAHRSRLILLGRPKTAPVRNLSPAIYPRFLGDRSIDRYQFRDASLVNGKWNFSFFFFFSRQKNSIRDTGIFIRVSNSFFFSFLFSFSRVAASVSQSNRVILVVTEFLSSLPFAG